MIKPWQFPRASKGAMLKCQCQVLWLRLVDGGGILKSNEQNEDRISVLEILKYPEVP